MEFRDWLVIFCIFAIIIVLIDGWRRYLKNKHYHGEYTRDADELDDFPSLELPAGGARVVAKTTDQANISEYSMNMSGSDMSYPDMSDQDGTDPDIISSRRPSEETTSLNMTTLDMTIKVPLLLDSIEDQTEPEPEEQEEIEAQVQQSLDFFSDHYLDLQDANNQDPVKKVDTEDTDTDTDTDTDESFSEDDYDTFSALSASDAPDHRNHELGSDDQIHHDEEELLRAMTLNLSENSDNEADEPAEVRSAEEIQESLEFVEEVERQESDQHDNEPAPAEVIDLFASEPPGSDIVEPEEVLVVNVVAQAGRSFNGEQLMELVLACGMRYGNMDIFHRTDERRRLQFSMANCKKPGNFDIDQISDESFDGVSLFMTLPCSSDAREAFEYMYETANVLARHLHGVLKDDMHNVMRPQTKQHYLNRISEFARSHLLKN